MDSITQHTCWCAGSWCHELLPIWTQGGLQHQSGRVNVIAGWIRVSILTTTVCATRMICKGARFWITAVMLRAISTKKKLSMTWGHYYYLFRTNMHRNAAAAGGMMMMRLQKSIVVVGKSRYALNRIRIMPSRSAKRRNRKLPDWSF